MPPPSSKSCVETTQPKDWDTVKTESSTFEKISECFIIFILKSIHTQSNHGQYSIRSSPTREERQMRSPDRGLRQYTCILVIFKSNEAYNQRVWLFFTVYYNVVVLLQVVPGL